MNHTFRIADGQVKNDSRWVWAVDEGEELPIWVHETVLVRVISVEYHDDQGTKVTANDDPNAAKPIPPMRVVASMDDEGLGVTGWWAGVEEADDGDDDDDA
jgi:DNA-directed RNA polymerase subunit E'/Rpb7